MTGEAKAGMRTFSVTSVKWTPFTPAPTQTAPISPPNSACDELEGRPNSQVSRLQTIAPTSPAKIIQGVTRPSSTIPPEIVLSTSVDRNAPSRVSAPEIPTATFGGSAPVATEVAIALAVSWKPLVKSNASAVITTTTTRNDQ